MKNSRNKKVDHAQHAHHDIFTVAPTWPTWPGYSGSAGYHHSFPARHPPPALGLYLGDLFSPQPGSGLGALVGTQSLPNSYLIPYIKKPPICPDYLSTTTCIHVCMDTRVHSECIHLHASTYIWTRAYAHLLTSSHTYTSVKIRSKGLRFHGHLFSLFLAFS